MRRLCAAVFIAAASCGSPEPKGLVVLDRLATATAVDTLHVIAPEEGSLDPPYPGRPVDSVTYGAFVSRYPQLADFSRTYSALAVLFKLQLGPNRVGYVLRVPSQYSSSAADLWVYEPRAKRWAEPVHLADSFGDGCWYFREHAWILDLDRDGHRDVVRRRRDTWVDDNTRKAGSADTLWIHRGGDAGFAAPVVSNESALKSRFDIPHWDSFTDKSC
jgi:hypothetical protein